MKPIHSQAAPWWQRGVVYQIYPRSFQDSNGDGIGDLEGVITRLDYLSGELGIDVLWLSPIYPSPMVDFGYDVADYCDIDPVFGDLAIFDRLVAGAHQRGMKVLIDWVPNHTSDQHAWFKESRSSRNNPKRHWYIWRDPRPDGSLPNNWGSFFGGPAWTFDPASGQYYMHQFVKEQPELNWRNPELRAAMYDTLRFWMRRGVDGFRMDVIGLIIKDETLRDNPPNPNASPNLPPNDLNGRLLHIHNWDQDDVHPIIRQIRQVLDEFPDRCGIGELWGEMSRWVRYYGKEGDELQLPFNFRLMDVPWTAQEVRRSVNEMEAALQGVSRVSQFAWPNYVLGNHDRPRLASHVGGQAAARLAAMLLLTLRGTPTLYYGDEIGMENGHIPPDKIVDPQGKNLGPERTRDVARTPMQWDASPNAGFSSITHGEPWLPIAEDYPTRNVEAQAKEPHSIFCLYQKLLRLRRSSPALQLGSYQDVETGAAECYAYLRQQQAEKVLVVFNFGAQACRLSLNGSGLPTQGEALISTHPDHEGKLALTDLELCAQEGLVIRLA